MTQTQPTGPPTQPWGTPPPPKPKRPFYRQTWFIITAVCAALGLLGLLLLFVLIGAVASGIDEAASPDKPKVTTATTTNSTPTEPTTPAETYRTPKVSDFTLRVKVIKKENFGSAGSLITFRIQAGWPDGYDPSKSYEVTYKVSGPEDGAFISTFIVTGDEYEGVSEETVSTSSTGTKLTAKVTAVEEV